MVARLLAAAIGLALLGGAAAIAIDEPVDTGTVELAPPDPSPEPAPEPAPAMTTGTEAATNPTPGPSPTPRAPRSASPSATPVPPPTPSASPTPSPAPAPTPVREVPVRSGRIGDWADQAGDRPVPRRLRLPSLDLDLPVVAVGVAGNGEMVVPEDVDDTGWYRHGPAPGEPGNAVVAGHVDSREQGLGAFHRLVDLAVGDRVEVVADDDTTSTWEVTGRQLVDKAEVDPRDLFRRSGRPRLVLVTCGGEFDGSARSYRSNVVVVARPV